MLSGVVPSAMMYSEQVHHHDSKEFYRHVNDRKMGALFFYLSLETVDPSDHSFAPYPEKGE